MVSATQEYKSLIMSWHKGIWSRVSFCTLECGKGEALEDVKFIFEGGLAMRAGIWYNTGMKIIKNSFVMARRVALCFVWVWVLSLPLLAAEENVWVYTTAKKTLTPKDVNSPQWIFKVTAYDRTNATITLTLNSFAAANNPHVSLNLDNLIVEDSEGQVPIQSIKFAQEEMFTKGRAPNLESFRCNLLDDSEINFFQTKKPTADNTSLRSIVLGGASPTSIGEYAFSRCVALTNVTLNLPRLAVLNKDAFASCTGLVSISGIENVSTIKLGAFTNCTSLATSLCLTNLSTLGAHAFRNCTSLKRVKIRGAITNFPAGVFANCTSLIGPVEDLVPRSIRQFGSSAFFRTALEGSLELTCLLYTSPSPRDS